MAASPMIIVVEQFAFWPVERDGALANANPFVVAQRLEQTAMQFAEDVEAHLSERLDAVVHRVVVACNDRVDQAALAARAAVVRLCLRRGSRCVLAARAAPPELVGLARQLNEQCGFDDSAVSVRFDGVPDFPGAAA